MFTKLLKFFSFRTLNFLSILVGVVPSSGESNKGPRFSAKKCFCEMCNSFTVY